MADGAETLDLKEIVRPIILAQGNTFIKELLRHHGITIGLKKADFEKNLNNAIGAGELTRDMIEQWLLKVEGWGDQHVYILEKPTTASAELEPAIRESPHAKFLGVKVGYSFPQALALTAIRLDGALLSVDWHIGSSGWERAKSKDYRDEIDGERYEFRAYRDRSDRAVVRFEWQFDRPYCALFTQLPNDDDLHSRTLQQVFTDLVALGVAAAPLPKVLLSKAVKVTSQDAAVVAHSTKMSADGGYVDIVSTLASGGIRDVAALRKARRGVSDSDFGAAEGMLTLQKAKHGGLTRDVKATVYGSEGRFRIWVQCKRDDVYTLADLVWAKNT